MRVGAGLLVFLLLLLACGRGSTRSAEAESSLGRAATDTELPSYAGTDGNGIPRYAHPVLTDEERALLRDVYGIEDPNRLYVSDSSEDALLKYDTKVKRCRTCYVNSYRVGFVSLRRPGESWDSLERRVRAMHRSDFPPSVRVANTSLAALDPRAAPVFQKMLADARRAGFALRIAATYRSPEREAFLMVQGKGRTYTLTSLHSYGRAVDLIVGDGNTAHRATKAQWIAFRSWVTRYPGGFRILGTPDRTWDWSHVELPDSAVGFPTIQAALSRARACRVSRAENPEQRAEACDFPPQLPSAIAGAY